MAKPAFASLIPVPATHLSLFQSKLHKISTKSTQNWKTKCSEGNCRITVHSDAAFHGVAMAHKD